jgi:1-hydroxycarotenoid 3,4-desaturase
MTRRRVVVVGAGAGGLSAALCLAARGLEVTVLERASGVGGKIRAVGVPGREIDAGPTVFTMRWVFDELFAAAGKEFSSALTLERADVLARHAWLDGSMLDLFSDEDRSADAIAALCGPTEAAGYRRFCQRAQEIYDVLERPFMASPKPNEISLAFRVGVRELPQLLRAIPIRPLYAELQRYFRDPRLLQLFGRYATYVGSSPYSAPSTLMLIAHSERLGVWRVSGGMRQVAAAMRDCAVGQGASIRVDAEVTQIRVAGGCVQGVVLADGSFVAADAVIFNGDVAALEAGLLGEQVSTTIPRKSVATRSLSAATWCVDATTSGFALSHHNVFFSPDYREEFAAIFARREVSALPTVYVCAQDRGDHLSASTGERDRLLVLINAPAQQSGATAAIVSEDALWARAQAVMAGCGLQIDSQAPRIATLPQDFAQLFPASGGALYGIANHGMSGSFAKPGAGTKVAGLYLAGGTVHPGAGVPMATLSGMTAAQQLMYDWKMANAADSPSA